MMMTISCRRPTRSCWPTPWVLLRGSSQEMMMRMKRNRSSRSASRSLRGASRRNCGMRARNSRLRDERILRGSTSKFAMGMKSCEKVCISKSFWSLFGHIRQPARVQIVGSKRDIECEKMRNPTCYQKKVTTNRFAFC